MHINRWSDKRWWILTPLFFVTYSLAFLDRANYGFAAAAGINVDLGITQATSSLIGSLFFLGYFIFQIPIGVSIQRYSVRRVLSVCLVAWGVLAALTGVVTNVTTLMLIRFSLGVVECAVMPSILILVSNWFTKRERSRVNAALFLGNPVTVLWMSIASGYLVQAYGWRIMFVAQGLPAVLWGVVWFLVVRDRPEQVSWLSEKEKATLQTTLAEEQKLLNPIKNYREAYRTSAVWILGGMMFFMSIGFTGFLIWLPSILRSASSLSMVSTGWLASVPYFCAVFVMLPTAWLSDRLQNRKIFITTSLSLASATFFGLWLLGSSHFWSSFLLLTIAGVSMYVPGGPYFALIPEILPKNVIGGAVALINSLSALGAFCGSYLVGLLTGPTGSPHTSYLLMGVSLFIAVLFAAAIRQRTQRASIDFAHVRS
ncbi:MFS transporter [Paraburkholderia fynbosensis]|uniref:Quinolone resistance transporter n=1 Tax=Paraburkholderia fynbosensis TaxID=1200993 RepID=A0A6J5GXC8_9BURK|nr:MFS transporter [Paraburkholderia fynbosensis]CAB3807006.1 Quinolone resistance transporter [Paraburkholderia fynbosensis]